MNHDRLEVHVLLVRLAHVVGDDCWCLSIEHDSYSFLIPDFGKIMIENLCPPGQRCSILILNLSLFACNCPHRTRPDDDDMMVHELHEPRYRQLMLELHVVMVRLTRAAGNDFECLGIFYLPWRWSDLSFSRSAQLEASVDRGDVTTS